MQPLDMSRASYRINLRSHDNAFTHSYFLTLDIIPMAQQSANEKSNPEMTKTAETITNTTKR